MDIVKIGTELLIKKLGTASNVDSNLVSTALSKLLSGTNGQVDIGSLVAKFASNGGLSSILGTWLGDGDNSPIGAEGIESVFGTAKINEFASILGIDKGAATSSLSSVIPSLIDRSSSGGKLLENADGLLGMAKKFF